MTATDLVKYREDLGMTGKEFAAHLHVSPATVSQWEHGKTRVPRLVEKLLWVLQELERLKSPILPGLMKGAMSIQEVMREENRAYQEVAVPEWTSKVRIIPLDDKETLTYWGPILQEKIQRVRPVEPGTCQCGCGGALQVAKKTRASRGIKKGEFPSFISGHNIKVERKNANSRR